MKTYFGIVDYENDGDVFEFNGQEYDFVLEINEEGIVIRDSLDRFVPIGFTAAMALSMALRNNYHVISALAEVEDLDFSKETCV